MREARVSILGGGPAGLLAAISLRLAGAQVVVFEAKAPPIDKACGEGLMPNTLAALRELGVFITEFDGYPFQGIRFTHNHRSAVAAFSSQQGLGVRRTVLHRVLSERARCLGVDLRWSTRTPLHTLEGDLIVAADGLHSAARRHYRFAEPPVSCRYGFRRHFSIAPWSPYVEIYCGEHRQIYVTPVSHSETGVALLTANPHERLQHAVPQFPELQHHLRRAQPSSSERGALTVTRQLPRVTQPGIALLGDASGSVDAISGEGIGLAAEQALALGAAFRAGNLALYEHAHRRSARKPRLLATALLSLSAHDRLQHLAIGAAASFPSVANALLAAYVGRGPSGAGSCAIGSTSISLPNPERLKSQS